MRDRAVEELVEERAAADRPVVAMDVARAAGVSQKTVSRVVNGAAHVRPEVRSRVLAAVERLGYRPNRAARSLASGRSGSIGLLSAHSADYGPSSIMIATERAVRTAGYALVVVTTETGDEAAMADGLAALADQGVDAVVVNEPAATRALVLPSGTPVLSLSGHHDERGLLVVDADQAAGCRQAVDHLLGLGHRTVHHVAGPEGWSAASQRRDGWAAALAAAGVPEPPVVAGDWSARSGLEAGRALAADPGVTAVLAANDQMAMGVVRALLEAGRRVPEDVSVVGFDDVPEAAYMPVALTTVRQDLPGMARRGIALLLDVLEGRRPRAGHLERVPVELVVRESTAPPPPARRRRATGRPGAAAARSAP